MRIPVLLAFVLSLHAAELPFKPPVAYACDITVTDGTEKMVGRMLVGAADRQRMEIKAGGESMVIILRQDQKKMHMLMVGQKAAMTMPLDPKHAPVGSQVIGDPNATWKKTGNEEVNGTACDRYEYSGKDGNGVAWIDAKQGVMVRAKDAAGKGQTDFTNYRIGAQPAELFDVPKDYQVMPGMGGMMGGQ
jgi:hypothetical protein